MEEGGKGGEGDGWVRKGIRKGRERKKGGVEGRERGEWGGRKGIGVVVIERVKERRGKEGRGEREEGEYRKQKRVG